MRKNVPQLGIKIKDCWKVFCPQKCCNFVSYPFLGNIIPDSEEGTVSVTTHGTEYGTVVYNGEELNASKFFNFYLEDVIKEKLQKGKNGKSVHTAVQKRTNGKMLYILLFLLLAGFANAEGNLDENRPYREYDGLIFETDLDFDNIYGSIYFGYAFVWDYFSLGADFLNIRVVKDGGSHRIATNVIASAIAVGFVMSPGGVSSEQAKKEALYAKAALFLLGALNPTVEFFPLEKFHFPLSISGGYNFDWFALSPEHLVSFSTKMGLNLYFHLGSWWRLSALALYQVTDTYDLERGWKFRLALGFHG